MNGYMICLIQVGYICYNIPTTGKHTSQVWSKFRIFSVKPSTEEPADSKGKRFLVLVFFFKRSPRKIQKMGQVLKYLARTHTHTNTPELWTIVTHGTTKIIRMMMSLQKSQHSPLLSLKKTSWIFQVQQPGKRFLGIGVFFWGAILYNTGWLLEAFLT